MGKLEKESSKRSRKRNVRKIILNTIAATGVISVGLVAPNVVVALGKLGFLPNPRERWIINASLDRLRRSGLIKFSDGKYSLTPAGEKLLRKWELANFRLNKPRKWDGKWRIVIFDIPEKLKRSREQIRTVLSSAGFEKLQKSVWIFPYDCEDIITLFKTDLGVNRYILYIIADQLEDGTSMRRKFNLI